MKTTPAMVATTTNLPITALSQRTTQCAMCTALHIPYPTLFLTELAASLPHSNWSNMEESEDWDGKKTKRKRERREGAKRKRMNLYLKVKPIKKNVDSKTDFHSDNVMDLQDLII